ncbi:MAG: bifunctional phosphopantothenoylcysteine decarboxylase/phosphopantothenate--cysteine ligase CoaBC [Campylobacter sp.]|uniref:bifunctional phosphopantothenoylcysteine decarboxylase/phosphopantothenate--cysteine ligase CoaBC n=1 Tax=Campylobacter sp. TaxID=205 RepID=UPI002970248F|nr:bifunctional phosphopantothenoylcysteine decarboxylase/phosphopantothenate--cysteine ligase CoaBC [Campylobacter sp.]MDD7599550.1 bifunctional phosphopantothenoylcysteine decarboxylase/phosphopantothenate--cysteine ligase CoaBC [Campylobacteraceae bacterium]MDY5887583.1 bifunctional phosphopantothenoylcysteine decarboxylase/phosphopantothenate--cysteine ligase CoaBC [Campylobacter sp.]
MLNLEFLNLKDAKITLCVSSSISFYKAFEILSLLRRANAKVRVAMSEQTLKFCSPLAFEALSGECVLVGDNKPLAHIEYAKCDLMIIAPATANTINKIALGIADNAMLSCILACRAPKLIAPAANTAMLENPATQNSLKVLKERGFVVVSSCEKTLACGDVGKGALASPKDIVLSAARMLGTNSRISSINSRIPSANSRISKVIITAGACYEMIDDVRAITNLSSGKMGLALAFAYYLRGFDVTLISSAQNLPKSMENLEFLSFKRSADLLEILKNKKLAKDDLLVMAAAISDYIPSQKAKGKIKKSGTNLNLELKENIDILSSLKELKCKKIGFKMEMDEQSALSSAKNMLENKALDAVCLNVLKAQNYFGSEQNEVLFITKNSQKMLKMASKHEIAAQIAKLSENLSENLSEDL